MTKAELGKKLYDACYITGDFTLRSGTKATEYFDKYRFEARPELLREVAKQLAPLVPKGTELLAGLEMGGIPIATALSLETGIPCVFVRKEAKKYGTCKFAEGAEIKGKRLLIVEDVVTTGGQVIISSKDLRSDGAIVEDVVCTVQRNADAAGLLSREGLKLQALYQFDEIKKR